MLNFIFILADDQGWNGTSVEMIQGQLNSKSDFIKARAEFDSSALKIRFSNDNIYKKNLPSNSICKQLYSIAEKIRYESLGVIMLKGIEKNFKVK